MNIDEAVGRVYIDARSLSGGTPTERNIAFATMRYVHASVSPAMNEYLTRTGVSIDSWKAVLDNGAGLCQGYTWVMQAILQAFGVRSREIGMWYEDRSHVVLEVEWDGARHMFDPTWGAWVEVEGKVLSLSEIDSLDEPKLYLHQNELYTYPAYEPFRYLDSAGRENKVYEWK
jgi:hypothetical protein